MENQTLLKAPGEAQTISREPFYSFISAVLALICLVLMATLVAYHTSMTPKVRIFSLTKDVTEAVAEFTGEIHGQFRLQTVSEFVQITGSLANFRPGAMHGIHVLSLVPQDGVDRNSIHFGTGMHGCPGVTAIHHPGDLGNLSGDETGTAEVKILTKAFTLPEVLGRVIAITEEKDPCQGTVEGRIIAKGVIAAAQKEFLVKDKQ